jgi:hypothetical protein
MPKLPTYTAKLDGGAISGGRRATAEDLGSSDFSAAAHRIQKVGSEAITVMEEDESRKVLVGQAEIRAKYAKRLDEAAVNGEDLGKIREELDNELSAVTDGLQTRRGAETAALHAANTGAMFDNQANNIKVTRATVEARVAGAKFLNGIGAILATNPTYLPQAEQDIDAFVATLSRIPPEKRAAIAEDLKQNANMAAAMTNARLDPEGTKTAVQGGKFNLTPEQRQQVVNQADATVRAKRVDEAYQRSQKEYEERERDETARDGWFKQIMTTGAKAQDILNDPKLRPQSREHLVLFMEQRAKALAGQERKSDPGAVRELWMAIHAPDGTPGKIYTNDAIFEAVKAGRVNTTDANQLNSLVANQKDENNRSFGTRLHGRMQTVSAAMRSDPRYANQPELSAAIQIEMVTRAEREAGRLRKEGKSPDALLDPESKDYLFKPGFIKATAEDVQRQADAARPKLVDLRAAPEAATSIEVGTAFLDPRGVQRVMTKELLATLKKQAPAPAAQPKSAERKPMSGELYDIGPKTLDPAAPLPFDPMKGGIQPRR